MTAREYLEKVRKTSKLILATSEELAVIKARKENLKSVEISEKVKSSSEYKNCLDELIDEEQQIIAERRKIHSEWWHCREMIKQIGNSNYSDVLRYYYLLNYKRWDIVAAKMHMSERRIYTLHGYALEEFRKISGLS